MGAAPNGTVGLCGVRVRTDNDVGELLRAPAQWEFYVVPESELPARQKSIGVKKVAKLWSPVAYAELQHRLSKVVADLSKVQ